MGEDAIPGFPPAEDYGAAAVEARREWAAKTADVDLGALRSDEESAAYRGNIENLFGFVRLPIGIAGPLSLHGTHAQGSFLIPLATTEGTLVASYNRGMRAIRESAPMGRVTAKS